MIEFLFGVAVGVIYTQSIRLTSWWGFASIALLGIIAWWPELDGNTSPFVWRIPWALIVCIFAIGRQPTGIAARALLSLETRHMRFMSRMFQLLSLRGILVFRPG
jgi:hypothetical protein